MTIAKKITALPTRALITFTMIHFSVKPRLIEQNETVIANVADFVRRRRDAVLLLVGYIAVTLGGFIGFSAIGEAKAYDDSQEHK